MSDKEALKKATRIAAGVSRGEYANPRAAGGALLTALAGVEADLATLHSEIERRDAVIEAIETMWRQDFGCQIPCADCLRNMDERKDDGGSYFLPRKEVRGCEVLRKRLATLKDSTSEPDEDAAYQEMRDKRMEEEGW